MLQATPANWPYNHDSIGKKGWAFLLPTVTPEDARTNFPDHHSCKVHPGSVLWTNYTLLLQLSAAQSGSCGMSPLPCAV